MTSKNWEELTPWKRPWCWERLKVGGEGDARGWDDWMSSLTQWTWVWVNSGSWWWTGRPGVLQSMGSQRVRHDWVTELTELNCDVSKQLRLFFFFFLVSHFSQVWFFLTLWAVAHQAPLSMGILQARILEWVDISFFRRFSGPRNQTLDSYVSCTGRQVLYH